PSATRSAWDSQSPQTGKAPSILAAWSLRSARSQCPGELRRGGSVLTDRVWCVFGACELARPLLLFANRRLRRVGLTPTRISRPAGRGNGRCSSWVAAVASVSAGAEQPKGARRGGKEAAEVACGDEG